MAQFADLRKDYRMESLSENDVFRNPFQQFDKWFQEALSAGIEEPNAMTLATSSSDGIPSARIVLLKGYNEQGFVFFSNYESYKARQLEENPRACLVFFWKELERQVRITGIVLKVSAAESDEYFNSRPHGSRIGAWASPQSRVIESRDWLEQNVAQFEKLFNSNPHERPPHWGGYRIQPVSIEFWQGRSNRLHDRVQYSLKEDGGWMIERLAP